MDSDRLKLLELKHGDLSNERDRLRSARAGVTGRLGPLPASAGIVIGLAGAVADRIDEWAIWTAGGLFVAIILMSWFNSSLPPYRALRADHVKKRGYHLDDPALDAVAWLYRKISLEHDIYGKLGEQTSWTTLRPNTLQQAFDIERRALNIVQGLFALIILVLLAAILTH
jgi:hypothetical protein